jgi:hypothetical protein
MEPDAKSQSEGFPQPFLDVLEETHASEMKSRTAAVEAVREQLKDKLGQLSDSTDEPDLKELALVIEILGQQHASVGGEVSAALLDTYAPLIEGVMRSAEVDPDELMRSYLAAVPQIGYAWKAGSFLGGSLALTPSTPAALDHRADT